MLGAPACQTAGVQDRSEANQGGIKDGTQNNKNKQVLPAVSFNIKISCIGGNSSCHVNVISATIVTNILLFMLCILTFILFS